MNSIHVSESVQTESEKKPYTKPEIVYQAVLEAMAAVCSASGKNPGDSSPTGCSTSPYS